MAELFTQEQARAWLRKNNLKTGKSIQDAFINEIIETLDLNHIFHIRKRS